MAMRPTTSCTHAQCLSEPCIQDRAVRECNLPNSEVQTVYIGWGLLLCFHALPLLYCTYVQSTWKTILMGFVCWQQHTNGFRDGMCEDVLKWSSYFILVKYAFGILPIEENAEHFSVKIFGTFG